MLMSTAVALGAGAGLVGGLANAGLQFANLNYQKGIQEDIFKREDNSIQRRVSDLRKAGLSPVLAAGQGAGTGGVVSTQAPQLDGMTEGAQVALNVMKMQAEYESTLAQKKYLDMQAEKAAQEISKLQEETKNQKIRNGKDWLDYDIQRRTGTTSSQSGWSGLYKDIFGTASNIADHVKSGTAKKALDGLQQHKIKQEYLKQKQEYLKQKQSKAEDFYNKHYRR